jgi:AcrR family transcriptional regulator
MATPREKQRQATLTEIKTLARQQMQAEGTAAISLRGIARSMGVTVTALYRYYASRDDLITALITDAFNALADTLEAAAGANPDAAYIEQARQVLLAYRRWAIEHPVDFQLIYGNPIPAYHAPREVTVPAVVRGYAIMLSTLAKAVESGEAQLARSTAPPSAVAEKIQQMIVESGYGVTPEVFYAGIAVWTRLHGIIMLELFNHLQPVLGDVEVFYQHQLDLMLSEMTAAQA